MWAENTEKGEPKNFRGICQGIRGSSALILVSGGIRRTYHLACLKVAYYLRASECEPWRFEAREFLRTRFGGRIISAAVVGGQDGREYAVMFDDQSCVNEQLLEAGLADLIDPVVGNAPENLGALQAGVRSAEARKVGKWGESVPPAAPV
jgi:endonuclease YncB( thermonuclease family)